MAWALRAGTPASAANATGGTPSSVAVTLGAAVSLNDRIVVVCEVEDLTTQVTTISSVTDSLGNVYHQDLSLSEVDGSFTGVGKVFSAPVTVAGTPVVTANFNQAVTSGSGGSISAAAYSGLGQAANDVDVSAGSTGNSTSPSSGATGATTAANELVIGGYSDGGYNTTFTAGGSFIARTSVASTVAETALEDEDSGASGSTPTATGTTGVASVWAMGCVVYKLTAAAAPPAGQVTYAYSSN